MRKNQRKNSDKDVRRAKAETLLVERAQRTDEQQLAKLDQKFGVGQGAQKERARLLRRIEENKHAASK